jgi:hypothetical protein
MSQAREIAAVIEFPCSGDASFVTGATLMADGGSSIVYAGSLGLSPAEGETPRPHSTAMARERLSAATPRAPGRCPRVCRPESPGRPKSG